MVEKQSHGHYLTSMPVHSDNEVGTSRPGALTALSPDGHRTAMPSVTTSSSSSDVWVDVHLPTPAPAHEPSESSDDSSYIFVQEPASGSQSSGTGGQQPQQAQQPRQTQQLQQTQQPVQPPQQPQQPQQSQQAQPTLQVQLPQHAGTTNTRVSHLSYGIRRMLSEPSRDSPNRAVENIYRPINHTSPGHDQQG